MSDFLDNLKNDFKEIWDQILKIYYRLAGRQMPAEGTKKGSYEINLVPEVKAQMIRMQRIRNLVLFACLVISGFAVGTVLVLFGIKSGQDIAMGNQDKKMSQMSSLLNGYDELDDILTVRNQLSRISLLLDQRTVTSRVFGAIAVMLPQGEDDVSLSELRVDLNSNVIRLEGQTDAKVAPFIDYRVLESFKKAMDLTTYDYGRYVDIDGKEIPTFCIAEANADGSALAENNNYYAWWDLTLEGCEAKVRSVDIDTVEVNYHFSKDAELEYGVIDLTKEKKFVDGTWREADECSEIKGHEDDCNVVVMVPSESGPAQKVVMGKEEKESRYRVAPKKVKIWRTPQFDDWYNSGTMAMSGQITGVEHFESSCFQYSGAQATVPIQTANGTMTEVAIRWTSTNECLLAPNGMTVTGSTNGRDESDNLVLKFGATVTFSEDFFRFMNKHMIAIGPMGQNVTDSYVQIGGMFAQEARSCDDDDMECLNAGKNSGTGRSE